MSKGHVVSSNLAPRLVKIAPEKQNEECLALLKWQGEEAAITVVAELLQIAGVEPGGLLNGGIEERLNILNGMDDEEWLRGLHAAIVDMAKKSQLTKPARRQQQNCNAFLYSVIWEARAEKLPVQIAL
eukprot:2742232-Amphidinium_carterae.1